MDKIINFDLIDDPRNWVIVFLVLYLAALVAKVVIGAATNAPIQLPGGLI